MTKVTRRKHFGRNNMISNVAFFFCQNKINTMRNTRINNAYGYYNFFLIISLLFTVFAPTVTDVFSDEDGVIQPGIIVPLKKMEVSESEDMGCRQWSKWEGMELESFTTKNMDSQLCVNFCRIKGRPFAAVSNGNKCSCVNENRSFEIEVPQYRCNAPCAADGQYRCGGRNGYFQLFKIIIPDGKTGFNSIYVGCYEEENNDKEEQSRQLSELFSDTTLMTIGRCMLSCHSRFRKYAGLQRGTQCWCGDNLSTTSLLSRTSNSSACNIPCLNKATTCGGKRHIQMYSLNYAAQRETPLAVYVGCFLFVAGAGSDLHNVMYDYAITRVKSNEAGVMSISRCCYLCMIEKKPFAGLHRGDTCYCGIVLNSRREKFRRKNEVCNRPCTENKNHFCGGDKVMQVYKLRPLGYEWKTFGFHIETQ